MRRNHRTAGPPPCYTSVPMFLLNPTVFVWDLAILLLIALGVGIALLALVWLAHSPHASILLRTCVAFCGTCGILGSALVAYGSFIEPHIIVNTTRHIQLPLRRSLTIVVLGDFHIGPYKGRVFMERVVREANRALPDIILLTGDFIDDVRGDVAALEPLKDLRPSLGSVAVLGNHDSGKMLDAFHRTRYEVPGREEELTSFLEGMHIQVLRNASTSFSIGGETFFVAGIDDLWSDHHDLAAALSGIPQNAPSILLSHNPDVIQDPQSRAADLIVSGHTHGGQFRLPLIGPIVPIPDRIGRHYDQGIFALDGGTTLAIARGLGETMVRARLFAWPQVLVLQTGE